MLTEGSKGTQWVSLMQLCYSEICSEDDGIIKILVLFSGVFKKNCHLVTFRQKLNFLQGLIMLALKNTFLKNKKKKQSFIQLNCFYVIYAMFKIISFALLCFKIFQIKHVLYFLDFFLMQHNLYALHITSL